MMVSDRLMLAALLVVATPVTASNGALTAAAPAAAAVASPSPLSSAPTPVSPPMQPGMTWNYQIKNEDHATEGHRLRIRAAYANPDQSWVIATLASPLSGPEAQIPPRSWGSIAGNGCFSDVEMVVSLASGDRCTSNVTGTSWVTSSPINGPMMDTGKESTAIKVSALGSETVSVPAGQFTAMHLRATFKARLRYSPKGPVDNLVVDYWFAPSVSAPVKVVRHVSLGGTKVIGLLEELQDSGVRPVMGESGPSAAPLDSGYFSELGGLYKIMFYPGWNKELCDTKFPATSKANQVAYDTWRQHNQAVLTELDAQVGVMQKYWATFQYGAGQHAPDASSLKQTIEMQREAYWATWSRWSNFKDICTGFAKALQSPSWDIATTKKDQLAVIRKGPP